MSARFHRCSTAAHAVPQSALAQGWRGLLGALVLIAPLLLSGCMIQSKVQGRYVEDQGGCRDDAEGNIGRYEKPGLTTKDRNAQLVTLFSNCMAKKGWQVAKPKRTTTTGPHGPLDPYAKTTTTTTTTTGPAQQPGAQPQPQAQPQQQQQQPSASQQRYQQEQQRLIQQQQELARQQQQLQATGQQNTQAAAELTRQQQELLRQQLQLQQQFQQYQRQLQGVSTQMPVRTTTTPLSPSGGMPPLSQPSSGSYYQPGRPYTAPIAEPYGSGAGRNF